MNILVYDNIIMMDNNVKQVYSSIFIEESGIQILCAEFYNTRFNIIFQDKFPCEGLIDYKVLDNDKFIVSIKKALLSASAKIGASIKKVLLILPPFNFKRFNINANVKTTNGIIEKADIAKALSDSLRSNISQDLVITNAYVKRYTINGINTRKKPIGERCNDFYMSIDLLCCDRELANNYIKAISLAGYEVIDITLNNYSISKESLLMEKSMKSNVIILDIGRTHTYLSLLKNGSVQSSEIIHSGINNFIQDVYNSYKIDPNKIADLIKYSEFTDENKDDVIYALIDENNEQSVITFDNLSLTFRLDLSLFVDNICSMCKPIFDNGQTSVILTGEGAEMMSLVSLLEKSLNCDFKTYCPDEIGVRDPSFSAVFGSMHIYKEKADLNNLNVSCVDLYEYNNSVDTSVAKENKDGLSITTKIKNLFNEYLTKEDK